jgi:hypothetical protein
MDRVSTEFSHQTDPTALLAFINHEPPSFRCDDLHGDNKLVPAITSQRTKDLAGAALRVDPQQRSALGKITHEERQGSLDSSNSVHCLEFESQGLKHSPTSRQSCGDNLSNAVYYRSV